MLCIYLSLRGATPTPLLTPGPGVRLRWLLLRRPMAQWPLGSVCMHVRVCMFVRASRVGHRIKSVTMNCFPPSTIVYKVAQHSHRPPRHQQSSMTKCKYALELYGLVEGVTTYWGGPKHTWPAAFDGTMLDAQTHTPTHTHTLFQLPLFA